MASSKGDTNFSPYPIPFQKELTIAAEDARYGESDEISLEAQQVMARSLLATGTARFRDFSHLAPEIPKFLADKCTGCLNCVTQCPDTAILAKVLPEDVLDEHVADLKDQELRERVRSHFTKTAKYFDAPAKRASKGGFFGVFVDPTKCKGCAECVEVCKPHNALEMVTKREGTVRGYQEEFDAFDKLPDTPPEFINQRSLVDMMLSSKSLLYTGGAGSCMGCGEATALRMLMAATGFVYGPDSFGFVAATGCNTVYGSTYPHNPYTVPWTSSLFENAPADAMGIRMRWDQQGLHQKKLWVIGGDGAMYDIGFQALSRMLASGMDINVIVLDTQAYSNTGGQTSTASFMGQDSKMSVHGRAVGGKVERRKELGLLALMHSEVFVAQVITADQNHFYRAVMAANEFKGPSVVVCYTSCQPEHGVGDDMAAAQAKLARTSRAFPVFIYDPRKGESIQERLNLNGNPNRKQDWAVDSKTGDPITFVEFARSEARFAKHFDPEGTPSSNLIEATQERLSNWHRLQELAGLLGDGPPTSMNAHPKNSTIRKLEHYTQDHSL